MRLNSPAGVTSRFIVLLCSVAFVLATVLPAASQTPTAIPASTRNWWAPGSGPKDVTERGKFVELQTRTKVYLNVSFADSRQDSTTAVDRRAVDQAVKQSVSSQKGLQIVNVPATAEFAILVRTSTDSGSGERGPNFSLALDEDAEVSVDVTVVVPGKKQANGTFVPRVVWESSSPHAQMDAVAAARFTVDGFLSELKKLQDKKK